MKTVDKIAQAAAFDLKAIKAFKVVNYGADAPDYFPGVSAIGTGFDDVMVGVGETPYEAYQDALDELAEVADVAHMPSKVKGIRKDEKLAPEEAETFQFYVGIYYTLH